MTNNEEATASRRTAQNIRAHMAARNPPMTTKEFAGIIGGSYQTTARKLRGEQEITIDDLEKAAAAFGVGASVLTRRLTFPEDWENEL